MDITGSGVIFIDNKLVGLGLRGPNVPAPCHWGSIGGKSENNETPEQTAVRETLEETSIVLDINKLEFFDEFVESNGFIYRTFLYPCKSQEIIGQFRATDEITSLQFFEIHNIPQPTLLETKFIHQLSRRLTTCVTARALSQKL